MDNHGKATLLVVDDEPVNIDVMAELLRPGYRVLAANSAKNALQSLHTESLPDLILLDVMMPDMDGYTLLRQLKELPGVCDIPVIFVTALDAETDEQHGFELGAVDYIAKPIRPAIVLARVAVQLELKKARDRLNDQNSWLEAEIQRRMHETNLIQDVTLNVLAELAETRDTETGHHILRTQSYVETLARHLAYMPEYADQLNEKQQQFIVKAAPLHDIGKVGIPDRILLKPGRLTADEFEIMKDHTRIGARTIDRAIEKALALDQAGDEVLDSQSLVFLYTARDISLYHHEKWDGSGYPEGLVGDATPLSARLMAIADVYDAMTCKRVYKEAISHDEVVRYILESTETQFDPEVVRAFEENQDEFARIRRHFSEPEDS